MRAAFCNSYYLVDFPLAHVALDVECIIMVRACVCACACVCVRARACVFCVRVYVRAWDCNKYMLSCALAVCPTVGTNAKVMQRAPKAQSNAKLLCWRQCRNQITIEKQNKKVPSLNRIKQPFRYDLDGRMVGIGLKPVRKCVFMHVMQVSE